MNTCETCRYYFASPLAEPCESCHRDGVIGQDPTNWEAPTNADRIRAMTDEELATNFASRCCPKKDEFYDCGKLNGKSFSWEDCRKCWLDWLKCPAEENK